MRQFKMTTDVIVLTLTQVLRNRAMLNSLSAVEPATSEQSRLYWAF
jgi:hypothetical protein